MFVESRENEKVEDTLKRFKKIILRSGLMRELRAREAYVKPSVKRKLKSKAARSRGRGPRVDANAFEPRRQWTAE